MLMDHVSRLLERSTNMPTMVRYNKKAIKIFNEVMGNKKRKDKPTPSPDRIIPPYEENNLKYNLFNDYKKDIG